MFPPTHLTADDLPDPVGPGSATAISSPDCNASVRVLVIFFSLNLSFLAIVSVSCHANLTSTCVWLAQSFDDQSEIFFSIAAISFSAALTSCSALTSLLFVIDMISASPV